MSTATAPNTATATATALRISNLSFAYTLPNGKNITALRDLSLEIKTGEILGLIGESGCGKTTLCNVLMQSLPYSHGSIKLNDTEIRELTSTKSTKNTKWRFWPFAHSKDTAQERSGNGNGNGSSSSSSSNTVAREYYAKVQNIFQDPKSAMAPNLPLEHFALAPLINLRQLSKAEARARIEAMLHQVDLPADMLERRPHEASIGQLQRLNVIKSLAIMPQLLLCDEITSALDSESAQLCLELLHQAVREHHLSVLFISHDLVLNPISFGTHNFNLTQPVGWF